MGIALFFLFFACIFSYSMESEIFLILYSFIMSFCFFIQWYVPLKTSWPPTRAKKSKKILFALPPIASIIFLITLITIASFDVVGFWVFFYLCLGFVWLFFSNSFSQYIFNIFYFYDAVELDNKAAAIAFSGVFIGSSLIYAGANIGDGPGWWTVLIAGALGLIVWYILGYFAIKLTKIDEKITVYRDIFAGIRFGSYLLSSGLILGFASGGDWTSLLYTFLEFKSCWPVFILVSIFILIENFLFSKSSTRTQDKKSISLSISIGILYFALAILGITVSILFSTHLAYSV